VKREGKGERRDISWCENPIGMGNDVENQAEAYDSKGKNTSSCLVVGGKKRERMKVDMFLPCSWRQEKRENES